jgi:hypothetical protein
MDIISIIAGLLKDTESLFEFEEQLKHLMQKAIKVCVKFYSTGQMSGKKWEGALLSNCTLRDEHLEREVFPWILYQ